MALGRLEVHCVFWMSASYNKVSKCELSLDFTYLFLDHTVVDNLSHVTTDLVSFTDD